MCININREKIDELPHRVNVKRIRRIMRILGLKSVIRRKRPDYVKSTPEVTAKAMRLGMFALTPRTYLTEISKQQSRSRSGLPMLRNSSITLAQK